MTQTEVSESQVSTSLQACCKAFTCSQQRRKSYCGGGRWLEINVQMYFSQFQWPKPTKCWNFSSHLRESDDYLSNLPTKTNWNFQPKPRNSQHWTHAKRFSGGDMNDQDCVIRLGFQDKNCTSKFHSNLSTLFFVNGFRPWSHTHLMVAPWCPWFLGLQPD